MNFEAMVQSLIDEARGSNKLSELEQERIRKLSELTAENGQYREMLRDGFDLMNAIMLRTGLVFKIDDAEVGPLVAKVKAWNLLLRKAGIIKVAQGRAMEK